MKKTQRRISTQERERKNKKVDVFTCWCIHWVNIWWIHALEFIQDIRTSLRPYKHIQGRTLSLSTRSALSPISLSLSLSFSTFAKESSAGRAKTFVPTFVFRSKTASKRGGSRLQAGPEEVSMTETRTSEMVFCSGFPPSRASSPILIWM